MADQRQAVRDGVTKALAETGEDMTITRKTTVKDPLHPTKPGVETIQTWTARGYVYPEVKWEPVSMTRQTTTMVIFDPQSFNPPGGVTQPGDIVTDASNKQYRLQDYQNPRYLGDEMAFIHPVGVA